MDSDSVPLGPLPRDTDFGRLVHYEPLTEQTTAGESYVCAKADAPSQNKDSGCNRSIRVIIALVAVLIVLGVSVYTIVFLVQQPDWAYTLDQVATGACVRTSATQSVYTDAYAVNVKITLGVDYYTPPAQSTDGAYFFVSHNELVSNHESLKRANDYLVHINNTIDRYRIDDTVYCHCYWRQHRDELGNKAGVHLHLGVQTKKVVHGSKGWFVFLVPVANTIILVISVCTATAMICWLLDKCQ